MGEITSLFSPRDDSEAEGSKHVVFEDQLEFPAPTDEQVIDLKAKHTKSELFSCKLHGISFILKTATAAQWRRFKDGCADKKAVDAMQQLFQDCVVYPEKTKLADVLQRWPAVDGPLSDKIAEISGASEDLTLRKL